MKKLLFTLAFILVGLIQAQEMQLTLTSQDPPRQLTNTLDFGEIKKGSETVVAKVAITNTGASPLIIAKVQASCGCTVPTYPKEPIMPNETKEMSVAYSSTYKLGAFSKTVTIISNTPEKEQQVLRIIGSVVD